MSTTKAANMNDSEEEEDSKGNFWLQIMAECEANSPNRLPSSKAVLILGDSHAQKTQLVAKLHGSGEKQRKGNGLEYYFLNVRDEYCENQTKLDVWVLDDDTNYKRLLKYVINLNTIADTMVVLVASMTCPWQIFRSICTWVEILEAHIKSLDIPKDTLNDLKSKVLKRYQEYVEPTMSIYGNLDEQTSTAEIENNLGIEMVVVITQTEYMTTLQQEFGYIEEHFDFIQFSLRKFCLTYGAALLYLSVKEDRNCDILLKYLLHKIYSFPFRIPAMFLEKDSIFVPAGWDSENKILALAESLATIAFSSPFEDVIVKPGRLSDENRLLAEVAAQSDQDFLQTIQAALLRQPNDKTLDSNSGNSILATTAPRNPPRRISRSPQKKQLDSKLSTAEGDTVLQSFFKSLLKRQTSAPAERPSGMSSSRGYNSKSSASSNFDRRTSLESTSSLHSKGSMGSKSLGSSIDSTSAQSREIESLEALDELNITDDFNTEEIKELNGDLSASADFMKNVHSKAAIPTQDDEDINQLPEYFLSSQGASHCPADCCFPNGNSGTNGNCLPDMDDPELDRVKSNFNPPLRLLLDKSNDTCVKPTGIKKDKNFEKMSSSGVTQKNTATDSQDVISQ